MVNSMSRKCQLSGKGPMSGNNRSHALNAKEESGMLTYRKLLSSSMVSLQR